MAPWGSSGNCKDDQRRRDQVNLWSNNINLIRLTKVYWWQEVTPLAFISFVLIWLRISEEITKFDLIFRMSTTAIFCFIWHLKQVKASSGWTITLYIGLLWVLTVGSRRDIFIMGKSTQYSTLSKHIFLANRIYLLYFTLLYLPID